MNGKSLSALWPTVSSGLATRKTCRKTAWVAATSHCLQSHYAVSALPVGWGQSVPNAAAQILESAAGLNSECKRDTPTSHCGRDLLSERQIGL
jgi:hypothetical protein